METDTKSLFQITEAAHACGVSRSTLMRMEEKGLLAPAYVAPESGRRYYDNHNVARVLQIEKFKSMRLGAQEIAEIAKELDVPEEKSVLLQHLVLSHHGEPEFGAAVRPVCAESELLSYIDMIDSRMEIYREVLGATPLGGFSDRVFALDGKKLYHHE